MCRTLSGLLKVKLIFETYRGSEHTTVELLHSPQSQDQFPSHRHLHHQYSFSCQPLLSTFLWSEKLEALKCERMLSLDCTGRKLPCSLPLITWFPVYKNRWSLHLSHFPRWPERRRKRRCLVQCKYFQLLLGLINALLVRVIDVLSET